MSKVFYFWASVLVVSLVASGLTMRSMALQGIPYFQSLGLRGVFCLLLAIAFAIKQNLSIVPKSLSTQMVRAVVAGISLGLFTLSYNYLSASAIAVLSNIDVPLMLVFGPLFGLKASPKIRLLSLVSILCLAVYVSFLEKSSQLYNGLIILGTACFLLCIGYLFIKKSMNEENQAVTIVVPSIAIIGYGLINSYFLKNSLVKIDFSMIVESLIAGASMFGAYHATMKLYDLADLATAEFPTLVASIVIQPVEFLILKAPLEAPYLLSSIAFVLCVYLIMLLQKKSARVDARVENVAA